MSYIVCLSFFFNLLTRLTFYKKEFGGYSTVIECSQGKLPVKTMVEKPIVNFL
jgi:hypothetical protein